MIKKRNYQMSSAVIFAFVGLLCFGTAQAHADSRKCIISGAYLDLTNDRVELNCTTPVDNIINYDIRVSPNPVLAQMVLQQLLGAGEACVQSKLTTGTSNYCGVGISYDPDPNDNPPGCGQANCRLMTGLQVL